MSLLNNVYVNKQLITVDLKTNTPSFAVKQRWVDISEIAKKTLASFAIALLSLPTAVAVGIMKLTGVFVITSFALGHFTKPLHALNTSLGKHAFTPFKTLAETLSRENKRIIETDRVIEFANGKFHFNFKNYAKQSHDSLKTLVAPFALGLLATNFIAWVVTKPLYVVFHVPGFCSDLLMLAPIYMTKKLSTLTYSPIEKLATKRYDDQTKLVYDQANNLLSFVSGHYISRWGNRLPNGNWEYGYRLNKLY